MNLKTKSFNWKSSLKGDADSFIEFLHQLRSRNKGKKIALILDNVSYHGCKKIKIFLQKHKEILLFSLPVYSPEYNPVEQVWKWIKKNICLRKHPFHCIKSLKKHIKKLLHRNKMKKTDAVVNIGLGLWKNIFV